MTEREWIGKVHSAMYHQCQRRGYAAPVDVLMECGVLSKQKHEDWRSGRIPFLEGVCMVNLRTLSFLMRQMRLYAEKNRQRLSRQIPHQIPAHLEDVEHDRVIPAAALGHGVDDALTQQ